MMSSMKLPRVSVIEDDHAVECALMSPVIIEFVVFVMCSRMDWSSSSSAWWLMLTFRGGMYMLVMLSECLFEKWILTVCISVNVVGMLVGR